MKTDIGELQLTIEREKWQRYERKCGAATASTPDAKRLEQTWAELTQGKVSKEPSSKLATVAERKPGERLAEAIAFNAALRKLKAGHAGQASEAHKLPPFITYG